MPFPHQQCAVLGCGFRADKPPRAQDTFELLHSSSAQLLQGEVGRAQLGGGSWPAAAGGWRSANCAALSSHCSPLLVPAAVRLLRAEDQLLAAAEAHRQGAMAAAGGSSSEGTAASASTELCSSTSELLGAVIKELFLPQLVLSAPNIGTIVLLAAEESLCGRMVEAIKQPIAVFAC